MSPVRTRGGGMNVCSRRRRRRRRQNGDATITSTEIQNVPGGISEEGWYELHCPPLARVRPRTAGMFWFGGRTCSVEPQR